jgi:DNA-binding NarL/FixJ family response regulator
VLRSATCDVVIGDSNALFVDLLAAVLKDHGFEVLAAAKTLDGLITTLRRNRPALCLLDRFLTGGDSIAAMPELRAATAGATGFVLVTADNDPATVSAALEAGAAGYLHKSRDVAALLSAIGRILHGEVVVDVPPWRAPHRSPADAEAHRLAAHLTARERECLELVVNGVNTQDMAKRLGVSATTVRSHVHALLTKLGVHSRLEAASFAVRHGLLDQPAERPGPATRSGNGALPAS